MRWGRLAVGLALFGVVPVAAAQPRIDPAVRQVLAGRPHPAVLRRGLARHAPAAPRPARVLIELGGPADADALAALAQTGTRLAAPEGRPLAFDRLVSAVVPDVPALEALARLASVRRVALAPAPGPPPLDRSADLLDLEAARGARPEIDRWLAGRGTVLADIDTIADVYHPDFFHADAGWYDWIDGDGNGAFTAGVDGIDVDGDRVLAPAEVAAILPATRIDVAGGTFVPARGFDPAVDWVYADENRNRQRDYGRAAGFDDATPAFGEPLFVPDDVDGDGTMELHERFVRLGTSKFRAVLVSLEEFIGTPEHVYRRGVDLSSMPTDFTGGALGYADTLHGTGVLGIAAGGIALPSRRWAGVAPEADLLLSWAADGAMATLWSQREGADVVLHESAAWAGFALDGSDPWSQAIDATAGAGIAHACPVGNIGGALKHATQPRTGVLARLPLAVPADGYALIQVSLHHRGVLAARRVRLREPDGAIHEIGSDVTEPLRTGGDLWVTTETTTRGWEIVHVLLEDPSRRGLRGGTWTFEWVEPRGDVHGYVADDLSQFGVGVHWADAEQISDLYTIGVPSVADRCLAIGAIPGHTEDEASYYVGTGPEARSEVRGYSARGPRLDGTPKPDVVAPDNPWTATGEGPLLPSSPDFLVAPPGAYLVFSGTSGAGPHPAGILALLAQTGTRGDDAVELVRTRAVPSPIPGATAEAYGRGEANAGTVFGAAVSDARPTFSLRAEPGLPRPGDVVRLVPAASEGTIAWDRDYDGTWDAETPAREPLAVTRPDPGFLRFKARLRDPRGRIAEAAVLLDFRDRPDAGPPDAGPTDGGRADAAAPRREHAKYGCGCRTPGATDAPGGAPALIVTAMAALLARPRRR